MSDMEIACMVAILILMSGEHFKECTDYVEKIDMQSGERAFMENVISIARVKRQKVRGIS